MGISFNANEVYQMGIFIEENGQKFYKALANKVTDPKAKEMLAHLSEWEGKHRELFVQLKEKLPPQSSASNVWDPQGEASLYLKAAADSHIFNINKDINALVSSINTVENAIKMALQFEKDSVILFIGMKDITPENLGKSTIDRLIIEEKGHIRYLHSFLKKD